MYVQFDPSKHKGLQLFELSGSEQDGLMVDSIVPSVASFDQASKTPWFYFVETNASAKELDGVVAQPILATGRKALEGTTTSSTRAIARPVQLGAEEPSSRPGQSCRVDHSEKTSAKPSSKPSKSKHLKVGVKGGKGSGFHGHSGRPGKRGGSALGRVAVAYAKLPKRKKIGIAAAAATGVAAVAAAIAVIKDKLDNKRMDEAFERVYKRSEEELKEAQMVRDAMEAYQKGLASIPETYYAERLNYIKNGINDILNGKWGKIPLQDIPDIMERLKEVNRMLENLGPDIARETLRRAFGEEGDVSKFGVPLLPSGKERKAIIVSVKGGPGSGNYGHAGIQGHQGGSAPKGMHYTPMGMGTHAVRAEELANRVPKQVAEDVQRMAGADDTVQFHVVPEGYVLSLPKDTSMVSYRSLRKISSSHEAIAADPTAEERARSIDPETGKAYGKNEILIDKTPLSGQEKLKVVSKTAKGVLAGAIAGAVSEGGRTLLTELQKAIKKGEVDSILKFVRQGGGLSKSDPEYGKIEEIRNMIKFNEAKHSGANWFESAQSRHRSEIFTLDEQAKQRLLSEAVSAAKKVYSKRGVDVGRHAVAGAVAGATAGAAGVQLLGKQGIRHKYVLKQVRVGGQATIGRGVWAAMITKDAEGKRQVHVYGAE